MSNLEYLKYVKQEQAEITAFRRALKSLVTKAVPLQRYGDGNCGFVVGEVLAALEDAGLYSRFSCVPPKASKKVIGQKLRTQVFERDQYRCLHCGTHKDLRADHIHPESKGGATTLENLQTLCAPCNSRKGVKS